MIDTCNSLFPIFLNLKTINVLTILMNFSVLKIKWCNYVFSLKKIKSTFSKNKILCGT